MVLASSVLVAGFLALTALEPAGAVGAADVEGPRVRVVGTAQDGGVPHPGCSCERCAAARRDPGRRRLVASLAVLLPASRRVFLVDATPDLPAQLEALAGFRPRPAGRVDRAPLDGVLLTHAHVGHYLGLAFFGFEAVHTSGLPVYGTPRMTAFLGSNAPWDQLVRLGNVAPRAAAPETAIALGEEVAATPFLVPHRDEYTDTVGFLLAGPRARLLYVPDTDAWSAWRPTLLERLRGVSVALVDGTFHSAAELPGRDVATIGHPLITATMDLLQPLVDAGELRVFFTHLNHSNPALDPAAPERREIERRGFRVAEEGMEFAL